MNINEISSIYINELKEYHRPSLQYELDLEERARRGDEQAKHELIELTLHYTAKVAATFVATYGPFLHHDSYMDLVQEGNLAVLTTLEKALQAAQPGNVRAYLCGTAKRIIRSYCVYKSGMIQIPRGNDKYIGKYHVESLDAPHGDTELTYQDVLAAVNKVEREIEKNADKKADASYKAQNMPLRESLGTLTEKQRYVVERYYGLDGAEPETLRAISRRQGVTLSTAAVHLQVAKKKLRKQLQQPLIEAQDR